MPPSGAKNLQGQGTKCEVGEGVKKKVESKKGNGSRMAAKSKLAHRKTALKKTEAEEA